MTRDDEWDPFTPYTPEQKAVAVANLDQMAATLGIIQHPLELYPQAGPGDCDDCHTPQETRRQYHRVQLCDPCTRLREQTRLRLERHRERPPELTENP